MNTSVMSFWCAAEYLGNMLVVTYCILKNSFSCCRSLLSFAFGRFSCLRSISDSRSFVLWSTSTSNTKLKPRIFSLFLHFQCEEITKILCLNNWIKSASSSFSLFQWCFNWIKFIIYFVHCIIKSWYFSMGLGWL